MKGDYNEFHVVRDGDTIRYTCSIIPKNYMSTIRLLAFFLLCIVIVFSLFTDLYSSVLPFILLGSVACLLIAATFLPRPYTKFEWNLNEGSVKKTLVYASKDFTHTSIRYSSRASLAKMRDDGYRFLAFDSELNEHIRLLLFDTEHEFKEVEKVVSQFNRSLVNLDLPENLLTLYRSKFQLGFEEFEPGSVTHKSESIYQLGLWLLATAAFLCSFQVSAWHLLTVPILLYLSSKAEVKTTWSYQNRTLTDRTTFVGIVLGKRTKRYEDGYSHHIRYGYDSYKERASLILYAKPKDSKETTGFDIATYGLGYDIVCLIKIIQANMPDFKILDWHE